MFCAAACFCFCFGFVALFLLLLDLGLVLDVISFLLSFSPQVVVIIVLVGVFLHRATSHHLMLPFFLFVVWGGGVPARSVPQHKLICALAFGMALAVHDTAVDRLALAKTKGLLPC